MAKDPVLPLYYNDVSGETTTWTDEEFGAYIRLLIHQWRDGSLPNDYQRLTRIATSLATTWPLLKSKFELSDGVLKNTAIEEIRQNRAKHKEKQRSNVNNRYQTSTKHLPKVYQKSTKSLPLENENEIEKENELNNKKESFSKIEVFEELIGNNLTFEQMAMAHPGKDIKQAFEECWIHHSSSPSPPQEIWEWRQKLNSWLSIKKTEKIKSNGKSNSTNAKQQHTNSLIDGIKERYGLLDTNGTSFI